MERKKYAVVTAGGSGSRMGAGRPKQFLELDGVPILRRTLERLLDAVPGLQLITVLPEEHMDTWRRYCREASFHCPQQLVRGGFTRFHSVKNALRYVPDGALVAVHDGVRPLVSTALVQALFDAAQAHPAVIPVLPVVDTLKVLDAAPDGTLRDSGERADRSRIYGAQTPQVFRSEDLRAAYRQGYDTAFTDDASVVQAWGLPLCYLRGERTNLKITTPDDLVLAEAILRLSAKTGTR